MTDPARHLWIAWYGFLGTPVLALLALQVKFTMVSWVCGTGRHWALHLSSGGFVLLSLAGAAMAYGGWRSSGAHRSLEGSTRTAWLSTLLVLGMMASTVSTLVLIAMWLPDFFLGACD